MFLGDVPLAMRTEGRVFEDFTAAVGAGDGRLVVFGIAEIILVIPVVLVVVLILVVLAIGVHAVMSMENKAMGMNGRRARQTYSRLLSFDSSRRISM